VWLKKQKEKFSFFYLQSCSHPEPSLSHTYTHYYAILCQADGRGRVLRLEVGRICHQLGDIGGESREVGVEFQLPLQPLLLGQGDLQLRDQVREDLREKCVEINRCHPVYRVDNLLPQELVALVHEDLKEDVYEGVEHLLLKDSLQEQTEKERRQKKKKKKKK